MVELAEIVRAEFAESIALKKRLLAEPQAVSRIVAIADCCAAALQNQRTIFFVGNGGSAADAQHIAGELLGRFERDRPAWPALALSADSSLLTSVANDFGYEHIFVRQLQGLAKPGDVLVALSTSGNSPNVVAAVDYGAEHGMHTIALSGRDGGQIARRSAFSITVPSQRTARIQEVHLLIGHTLCTLIEQRFS